MFNGEIVYNKNKEDPAHFILRLNTLKKLMPTYDLAGSSKDIISEPEQKINPADENSSKNSRRASAELDNRYMSAVNRGDMVKAQRMVDEAAREAGYAFRHIAVYHIATKGSRDRRPDCPFHERKKP